MLTLLVVVGALSGCNLFSGSGNGGPLPLVATLTVEVRDACNNPLPGVWVAVQDQVTTYFYQTTATDLQRQFVNLRAPYAVTFSYTQPVPGFPRAQSFLFRTDMILSYRVPVNGDQCPPPPPPAPTYGTIDGTITGSSGGPIDIFTSFGNFLALPAGGGSSRAFTMQNVRTGTMLVYAFEKDGTNRRIRFGFTRNVVISENQSTPVTVDLNGAYNLHLTGDMLYPAGFTPDSTPIPPSVFTSLSIVGAGFISNIGESLQNPPLSSFDILLPDFSALGLDPGTDNLLISASAIQTRDTRGTPSNADDWRRTLSWSGTRLVGQIISGQPVNIQFPEPATAESPPDGASVPRSALKLKWRPPQTGEPTSYFVQILDAQTNQVLWNVSSANIGYTEIRLPVFPGGYDPLPSGKTLKWAVYASFPNGSTSDFGLLVTPTPS